MQYLNFNKSRANYSIKHSFGLVFNKIETVFFSFLCVICLIVSKVDKDFSRDVSVVFVDISLPVAKFSASPFNFASNLVTNFGDLIYAKKENENLRKELDELRSFYFKSLNIHQENKELREMLHFVSAKSTDFKVAQIIGRSRPVFNQKVFIDAGSNRGLTEGEIVIGKRGVLGRIVEVYEDKSHLLLLNDATSRVPIITSKARARGVLAGNSSGLMEILYLPKNHAIQVGEMVFTSGDGDTLPSGLFAGVVRKVDKDSALVSMVEDVNNSDLVTILAY
ncbi:MAG: rod shape-determining protein MreC [Proteobacteria bacterium]|nr:rod shape-determining protein MreC [Pseudomonadota bacterium]